MLADFRDLSEKLKVTCICELNKIVQYLPVLPHEFQIATGKRSETRKRCIWVALETSEKQKVEY
jgi:hypothetical protein